MERTSKLWESLTAVQDLDCAGEGAWGLQECDCLSAKLSEVVVGDTSAYQGTLGV